MRLIRLPERSVCISATRPFIRVHRLVTYEDNMLGAQSTWRPVTEAGETPWLSGMKGDGGKHGLSN